MSGERRVSEKPFATKGFWRCALVHRDEARRCGAALNGTLTKIVHRLAQRFVRHHAMTMLSLLEAAEQVGKSKSTLWRASKRGELSVTKNEDGQILVDRALVQTAGSGPAMMSAELPEGWAWVS